MKHTQDRPQETVNTQGVPVGCRAAEKTVRKPAGQQEVRRRESRESREERAPTRREKSEVLTLEHG